MKLQAPAMQNLMSNYMEQSSTTFLDMQNRMQEQTKQLFSGFAFPGFPIPPAQAEDNNKK